MYPPTKDLCYILGVLQGDGCISQIRIRYKENIYEYYRVRLVVNSKSFTDAFRLALWGIGLKARTFDGGVCPGSGVQRYETCAYSNEFFNWYTTLTEEKLLKIIKAAPTNVSSFIRGFFDSEGTVSLYLKGRQKRLFITMYNTDVKKLKLIKSLLASPLGINAKIYPRKIHGSKAKLPKWKLSIDGKANLKLFVEKIGSECEKKRQTMNRWVKLRDNEAMQKHDKIESRPFNG